MKYANQVSARENPSQNSLPVRISNFRTLCETLKCSQGGTRTPDKVVNSHLLYQLSYLGICAQNSRLIYFLNSYFYRRVGRAGL